MTHSLETPEKLKARIDKWPSCHGETHSLETPEKAAQRARDKAAVYGEDESMPTIVSELSDLRRRLERLEAAAREANVVLNMISDDASVSNRLVRAARQAAIGLSEAMK